MHKKLFEVQGDRSAPVMTSMRYTECALRGAGRWWRVDMGCDKFEVKKDE